MDRAEQHKVFLLDGERAFRRGCIGVFALGLEGRNLIPWISEKAEKEWEVLTFGGHNA